MSTAKRENSAPEMVVIGSVRYRQEDAIRLGMISPIAVDSVSVPHVAKSENDEPQADETPQGEDDVPQSEDSETEPASESESGDEDTNAATEDAPAMPASSAAKQAWVDYALAQGKTQDEIEGLSRDRIAALFTA